MVPLTTWHKVTDSLPALSMIGDYGERESSRVLCLTADGFAFVGRYVQAWGTGIDAEPAEFYWAEMGCDSYTHRNVTHWSEFTLPAIMP